MTFARCLCSCCVCLCCVSLASLPQENVRILALLDQMELLANGEEGAKAGDDEDGKDPEERGKRPNKASRARLVQELRERIGRLEAQLPKTEVSIAQPYTRTPGGFA